MLLSRLPPVKPACLSNSDRAMKCQVMITRFGNDMIKYDLGTHDYFCSHALLPSFLILATIVVNESD